MSLLGLFAEVVTAPLAVVSDVVNAATGEKPVATKESLYGIAAETQDFFDSL